MTSRLPRGVTARDGRYQLTIDTGTDPLTGKRRRASVTFCDLADYEVVRARLVLEHHGKRVTAKSITFGQLLERWFAMVASDLGPRTADGYRAIIDNYAHGKASPGRKQGQKRRGFPHPIGALALPQVTTERLDAFYMRLRTEGGVDGKPLTAQTCRRIHAVFGPALALAVREGLIAENPAPGVFLGRRPKTRARKLPPLAHVWAIISECNADTVDAAMLGLCIGAREGELAGIRWGDVDLDAGTISIVRTVVVRADRSVEIVDDDGRKSDNRTFALPKAAIPALSRRRAACAHDALLCGVPLDDCYVLGEIPGQPLSPDTIGSRWRRAEKRAGVKFRFHDLRHYHTSLLLDAGVPTPTIVSQLGWTSPQMIGTYGHTVRELDTRAAAVIDGTVGDRFG